MWLLAIVAIVVSIILAKPFVFNKYLVLGDKPPLPNKRNLQGVILALVVIIGGLVYYNTTLIDINTATFEELMSLPEIGKVNATKIIKHRYYDKKSDLKEILTDFKYDAIKYKIKAGHVNVE